jgi:hypothetical protein
MPSTNERVFTAPPPAPRSTRRGTRRAEPVTELPPPRAEPVDPAELEALLRPPDEDEE